MRLASVLTPLSDENLQLAAQCGVSDVVIRYPGPNLQDLLAVKERIEAFSLRVGVVEGYLPMENVIFGNEHRDGELEQMAALIRHMDQADVRVLCYNFMAGTDWVRTAVDVRERGGALVTAFRLADAEHSIALQYDAGVDGGAITADELWQNLEYFLKALVPVAERHGVFLAMHPDDPPLESFQGRARIMNSPENFERLVELFPSPHNGICFCQGTFAEMGVDIPATIRRLGKHIRYVHFRDVRGTREDFVETFHDNGQTDMPAAMRAYREVGFEGPIRPDHVPQLVGEEQGEPGYTMLGRLFAYGYIRGLLQATE